MEFSLLGAVFFAVIPLYVTLYWEARRGNAATCTKDLWDVALTAAVVGLFVGRLAAMISDGVNPISHPADVLIVRGGVATGPAAAGAILTAAWIGRRELWPVLDGLAAAGLAGLAGWHAGCLARDACLGTASDLPWAMAQNGSSVTRHPVEIYSALGLAIGAIAVALWRKRGRPFPGLPVGIALSIASAVRLATEPLRPTLTGGAAISYWAGLLAGLAMAAYSVRQARDRRVGSAR
jgi:prolipoprotein diacylglyceryltransferase